MPQVRTLLMFILYLETHDGEHVENGLLASIQSTGYLCSNLHNLTWQSERATGPRSPLSGSMPAA